MVRLKVMARWIGVVIVSVLVGCGGTEGAQGEPSPATDAVAACPTNGDAGALGTGDGAADAAPDAQDAIRCGTGLTLCADERGRVCVDTQDDSAHCGFCGLRCPAGTVCGAGRCL